MSRRRLKNLLLAFVGVGVLLQLGGHLRHIVQSLQNDAVPHARTTAATRPVTSPRPRATALKWTATLAGRVVLEDGHPAANARVFLEGPSAQSTECDESGAFSFGQLRPGDYQLFALLEPLASERLGPLPLGAGEDLRDLTLEVREGALLEGVVVSSTDRRPVSGATIHAAGLRTNSDDTGHFSLVGLPRGRLVALVEAEGFVPRQIALSPPAQRLTLALERGAKVFGTVRAQGMPAVGVAIAARRYDPTRQSDPLPVAFTDARGHFAGFVPTGPMALIAGGQGWAEAISDTLDLKPGEERGIDFELHQGGAIAGRVLSADQTPQSACRVQARDASHDHPVATATSGKHGEFWLTSLPPATYSVLAQCPEGGAELTHIQVSREEELRLDIVLGAARIAGRVVDASGHPVAQARIDARSEGRATRESPFWTSDINGHFSLTGLAGERFTVTARSGEGEAQLRGVKAGSEDLILVLTTSGIEGVARDAYGQRLGDFTLAAIPTSPSGRERPTAPGRPRSQRFVSAEGRFHLPLLPGLYELKVASPGMRGVSIEGVDVRPNRLEHLDLELPAGMDLSGDILSAEDGSPVAHAIVASHPHLLTAFGRAAPVSDGSWTMSDETGAFTLTGLVPDAPISLFVDAPGFEPKVHRLDPPVTARPRIRLTPKSASDNQDSAPDAIAGIGLSLSPREGRLFVGSVLPFGPAQAAGVQVGDELLRVDGQVLSGSPLSAAINAIRGPVGSAVTLTLERQGTTFDIAIPRVEIRF